MVLLKGIITSGSNLPSNLDFIMAVFLQYTQNVAVVFVSVMISAPQSGQRYKSYLLFSSDFDSLF